MRKPEGAMQDGHQQVEVDKLSRKYGKYALVVAVSKRARHLKERAQRMPLGPSAASYIERALRDVSQGRLKITKGHEE